MSTKSKSALSETPPNSKAPSATPRSKSTRGLAKSNVDSASPVQNARVPSERSPISGGPKPTSDRRSPKLVTTPDKKTTPRISKPLDSELRAELNLAHEDLKKANEKLILVEKEKSQALDELKKAQTLSEEANEKLSEALVAQKHAEENSEIEKFRALEMEQTGIEIAQKKDEWQKEIESIRNQHALDIAALLSMTEELQKIKQELAMTCDAKKQALSHADEATKLAEINAEKVEAISAELAHLKSVLDSKAEKEASEKDKVAMELKLEIDSLKKELERTRGFEEKLAEKEAVLEQLHVDLEAAKMEESYAHNLAEELNERAKELASQTEHAKRLERSASESMESVVIQLGKSNNLLHEAETEISSLKQKMGLLEISIERQKRDLEESEYLLELSKEEASEMANKIKSLTSELDTIKEEKIRAANNEKLEAGNLQTLLEEKNSIFNELEASRNEEEKSKKALESLTLALHEISAEAREGKEKLLSIQVEHENYESEVENLKLVLKATNEKYENMLDDAKRELDALTSLFEQSKKNYKNLNDESKQKELYLIENFKEDKSSMENEINRLVNLLKTAEEEALATREEENHWKNSFEKNESEMIYLKKALDETKNESMKLKEVLMNKEKELRNILNENEELQKKDKTSVKRVEELLKLLEEALAKKQEEENGELTDCEKDYDMLPKVVEFSEENGTGDVKPKEKVIEVTAFSNDQEEKLNEKIKENGEKEKDNEDSAEGGFKMWESCKIEETDFSPEDQGLGSFEGKGLNSKGGDNNDKLNKLSSPESVENTESSPTKENSSQKKKKPLLSKFGSMLKKKKVSTTNHQK